MKHHRSLYLIYLILFTINSYHCNQSDELRDEQENSIIKSESEDNFQQPKTGPVNLEIIGDTSHLFKEEDFEKKEAILLSINHDYINNNFSRPSSAKKTCTYSSANQDRLKNSVKLVNGSELTKYLSDSDETECFLVLFYVPWCPFSARLAPIYNALPRAFLSMSILAFDVSNSVGYNTKFGTSAVPMVILFQHKNVLARMNCTGKTLPDYIEFVGNMTKFEAVHETIEVEAFDFEGPVPTKVLKKTRVGHWALEVLYFLLSDNRQRRIAENAERHMILNAEEHLHND